MTMTRLVTCDTSFQAELIKGRLADQGIECILTNQCMNQLYAPLATTFTTVDILVRREDLDKAITILKEESTI